MHLALSNMQCGLEQMNDCERSPNRTNLRVNFNEKGAEVKERREKFLTAKYGSHQMSLIRKRLAVEMWLYDELQKLIDPPVSDRPDMIQTQNQTQTVLLFITERGDRCGY